MIRVLTLVALIFSGSAHSSSNEEAVQSANEIQKCTFHSEEFLKELMNYYRSVNQCDKFVELQNSCKLYIPCQGSDSSSNHHRSLDEKCLKK